MTTPRRLWAVLLFLVACLAGCTSGIDLIYRSHGPRDQVSVGGVTSITGLADRWTEISFHREHGLVCSEVLKPSIMTPHGSIDVRSPNGWKTATQFFTVTEAAALGLATYFHLDDCDGCSHTNFTLMTAPFFLDLAWGLYRSFTIRNPIYKSMDLRWSPGEGSLQEYSRGACPPGTAIDAQAQSGARLALVIDLDGQLRVGELRALYIFVKNNPGFTFALRAGGKVILDQEAKDSFLARVRTEVAQEEAQTQVYRGDSRPEPRSGSAAVRALIEWRGGIPIISGIKVDVAIELICRDERDCTEGQRCLDRGDGIPMCMGPGASHGYCGTSDDCRAGEICRARSDGARMCQR